jgi:hypothetical protein
MFIAFFAIMCYRRRLRMIRELSREHGRLWRIIGVVGPDGSPISWENRADLDLKKEVEQVTTSALEGPAWRFAWIRSAGITDAA